MFANTALVSSVQRREKLRIRNTNFSADILPYLLFMLAISVGMNSLKRSYVTKVIRIITCVLTAHNKLGSDTHPQPVKEISISKRQRKMDLIGPHWGEAR